MIQLSSAGKRYGPKLLFEDLDWLIAPRDRIGLVGANGTGKSTLLKVLGGLEDLDYGSSTRMKGITVGYLPQDGLSLAGRSVFAECLSVFDDVRRMEEELEALTGRMGELDPSTSQYNEIADRFHHLQNAFRARDGYAVEAHVGAVLTGLCFRKQDWTRGTEEFSGGWQMRIAMAKLLLQRPNLLLLDEPTNHLDLEARNWLEDYLRQYPCGFVVVSHDRYFLDVTIEKIVEIWNQGVHFYPGNYEQFLRLKQQRKEQLEATFRNQQQKVEQLQTFINRFRYQATKAKQVQSRIKELARMERVAIPREEEAIHFTFPQPAPSGRVVAEFKNVGKRYDDNKVFRAVSFVAERGDRVALIGANGAGKSTLIKLLAGSEQPTAGEIRLGHNVEVDYFAQDQYKELDGSRQLLADLESVSPRSTTTELRSLLGCFLFSGDDVFKTIGVLSGGERNRYAVARMLMRPSNLLLLDEPTNHLDLRAKDVLLEALQEYTGTLVFVSHDRYFIDRLATRVFEVGAGCVQVYPGNYEDYLWRKQNTQGTEAEPEVPIAVKSRPEDDTTGVAESTVGSTKPKRINPLRLRQLKQVCEQLEEEITRAEEEIADCETALTTFVSVDETKRLTDLLGQRRGDLEKLLKEWEEISQTIESNP